MIAVLKNTATETQIENIIEWIRSVGLDVHISRGHYQTVLGLIGDTRKIDEDLLSGLDIVETVTRISEPFKQASRKFHPDDSVIEVGNTSVGGDEFAFMAGPCSVESEEQIVAIAREVKALGATDQHSQVQLYTEGPFDKVVTFLSLKKYACEMPIPHGCENIPDVAFLGGHTMEELIQAENAATAYALTKAGRMNYTIWIPELNAFTLGQLLFMFELQTAYAGAMLNIDTFNQPGVEEGKKATFALLGKKGYEGKKQELDSLPEKNAKYIV